MSLTTATNRATNCHRAHPRRRRLAQLTLLQRLLLVLLRLHNRLAVELAEELELELQPRVHLSSL